jgi:hypothetical protein
MNSQQKSYLHRTIDSMGVHCKARGLDNSDGFILWVEKKWGKELSHFHNSDLKRLNRNLGDLLTKFLGGKKRVSDFY